jgi:hypothetical protein
MVDHDREQRQTEEHTIERGQPIVRGIDLARSMARTLIGPRHARTASWFAQDAKAELACRFTPAGRRSASRLRSMTGSYSGQRCVIVGNGPSLNLMDLSKISSEKIFCLNRGYLLFDRIGRPADFLVCVNCLVIDQSLSEVLATPSLKFLSWPARRQTSERRDVVLLRSRARPGFYATPGRTGLWVGATVTFVALQLAFVLGFEEVILIGVDHRFTSQGQPHSIVAHSEDNDPNHFDPSYFGAGYRWQLPDLEQSEQAYRLARSAYETAGRRIIDATVDGNLRIFPKMGLAEALAGSG